MYLGEEQSTSGLIFHLLEHNNVSKTVFNKSPTQNVMSVCFISLSVNEETKFAVPRLGRKIANNPPLSVSCWLQTIHCKSVVDAECFLYFLSCLAGVERCRLMQFRLLSEL